MKINKEELPPFRQVGHGLSGALQKGRSCGVNYVSFKSVLMRPHAGHTFEVLAKEQQPTVI